MSNIIDFRPEPSGKAPPARGDLGRILFFTGIRYIRETSEDADEDADQARSEAPAASALDAAGTERLKA